jgi:hypothetical protein
MKKLILFTVLLLTGAILSAQTADDVISKYLDAIGGKKKISKIKALVVEGTMEMEGMEGMEGAMKTTTLSGKGVRIEIDMMGSTVVNCITEQGGWTINPFMGGTTPEDLPKEAYDQAKYQLVIGGPFINYKESGFLAEIAGERTVGDTRAVIVKMTSPEGDVSEHYFDTGSGYLIRSVEGGEMGDNITTFSDYKGSDGFLTPHSMEISAEGGQAYIYLTVEKVEVNAPVEESLFSKPE